MVDRIEQLDPQWVHAMHGGTLTRRDRSRATSTRCASEPFAFQGKSLGREIPASEPAAVSG